MTSEDDTDIRALCEELRKDVKGFPGTFLFQPEHTTDRGIGLIADNVDYDDRLVYVPPDGDVDNDEDVYTIADNIESHVAEPIARMLNAIPELLEYIEELEKRCTG